MVAVTAARDEVPTVRPLAVAVGVAVLVAIGWGVGWLPALERPGWDLMLRLPHPGGTPSGPCAAVLIDDASIARLSPLPWPRVLLAELVEAARAAGATAVVVDMLLSEPGDPADDAALAAAIDAGPTVLGAALVPGDGWLLPAPRFGASARAAHVHAEVDRDGVVRSVLATKQTAGLALPALAVAAAELAGDRQPFVPGQRLRPDFRLRPDQVPAISAAALLDGAAVERRLAGRVVFIGASATGASDQLFVPVGDRHRPQPGVLVHAATAAAIVRGGLLLTPPAWLVALATLMVALAIQALRARAGRLRRRHLAIAFVLLIGLAVAGLWTANLLLPIASLGGAVTAAVVLREAAESRATQRQTGAILAALVEDQSAAGQLPAGVQDRLQLARRLQSQLARDRDLRRTLLEGLAEGVVLWDAAGQILVANRAAAELWDGPPVAGELRSAATGGVFERRGRVLEVEVRSLPPGALGLVRDVTDRVTLDRRRREMQRLVSHELKTPLASIAGFGEMLATYELSRDELQRVAGLVRSEADRLGAMVRAFLDLERMDAGAWRDEIEVVDLGDLVRTRCELLRMTVGERRLQLTVVTGSGLVVRGVPRLLEQLVDNLVGNALKYSPDGATVAVELRRAGAGGCFLSVADDGPGIPAEAVPHLFERFYRVPGTRREGSGLGLAIVKEVADWHRATVSVDTAPSRGTRMMVEFETATEREDDP